MTWTRSGYRHPPCVACQIAVEMEIRDKVKTGRCYVRGVGDVCSYHFHVLTEVLNGE